MSDFTIRVEGLGKAYRLGVKAEQSDTLVGAIASLAMAPLRNLRRLQRLDTFSTERESDDILWALKDVSFEVKEGEVVGFVGRNGAGKSTLLKILSRITDPTEGRVMIRGRVSSLLEVGTGFHPELTGRENIYMNGTILGMKKRELDRKFDEIVDFSGVERFLDTPVKRYSSGMKVRLAFSVAAHLEPELLIVDEVLAVGDAEFQRKCLGKMEDVAGGGRTVLFVSHNMGAVQNLCPRAIALRNGRMVDEGPSAEVIRRYIGALMMQANNAFDPDNPDRKNSGVFRFTSARLTDTKGHPTESVMAGATVALRLGYESHEDLDDLAVFFTVFNDAGVAVTHINTNLKGFSIRSSGKRGTITCTVPNSPFAIGDYRVAIAASSQGKQLDLIPGALKFSVMDSVYFGTSRVPMRQYCTVYVDHEWGLEKEGVEAPVKQAAAGAP